jgi:hypothetical protein
MKKRTNNTAPPVPLQRLVRPLPRYPGRTYVMMREGDPWHACHVTILPHTKAFKIHEGPDAEDYFDCFLPKRWRKVATAQQDETRPVRRSELW